MIFCVSAKSTPLFCVNLPFSSLKLLIIYFLDVPKEISNKMILDDYLPFAKATIHETCTIVAATRVRSDQILIPTNESYTFSKQYGDKAELNITFPAGVAEKTQILEVQVTFFCGALWLTRVTYELMYLVFIECYLLS